MSHNPVLASAPPQSCSYSAEKTLTRLTDVVFYSLLVIKAFDLTDQWSSGRVNRASTTETVEPGSIPGPVKPNTLKIGIYSFPA